MNLGKALGIVACGALVAGCSGGDSVVLTETNSVTFGDELVASFVPLDDAIVIRQDDVVIGTFERDLLSDFAAAGAEGSIFEAYLDSENDRLAFFAQSPSGLFTSLLAGDGTFQEEQFLGATTVRTTLPDEGPTEVNYVGDYIAILYTATAEPNDANFTLAGTISITANFFGDPSLTGTISDRQFTQIGGGAIFDNTENDVTFTSDSFDLSNFSFTGTATGGDVSGLVETENDPAGTFSIQIAGSEFQESAGTFTIEHDFVGDEGFTEVGTFLAAAESP